jgi:DNA-binding CsgD family transcriptional regulator
MPARIHSAHRSRSGWDSLSPTETRVVELVATGATNKAIARQLWVSPHTVDTHLRHSFAKLGLRSRVALAALVTQRRLAGAGDAP